MKSRIINNVHFLFQNLRPIFISHFQTNYNNNEGYLEINVCLLSSYIKFFSITINILKRQHIICYFALFFTL